MKKTTPNFAMQQKITGMAAVGLDSPGYETDCGQCKRWVRQVLEACKDAKIVAPPVGIDAAEALQWYAKNHPEMIVPGKGVPGDLLFKFATAKNRHGHVAIRIYGNRTAENFISVEGAGRGDCRGSRTLQGFGRIDAVVRPYKNK